MQCSKCSHEIEENALRCEVCGEQVQMVPDYSPLEETLVAQIKGNLRVRETKKSVGRTAPMERTVPQRTAPQRTRNRTEQMRPRRAEEERLKRQKMQRMKRLRIKRLTVLGVIMVFIVLFVSFSIYLLQNTYQSQMNKGHTAFENKDYEKAGKHFENALKKEPNNPDVYAAYANVMRAENKIKEAEALMQKSVSDNPKNAEMYEGLLEFYLETNNQNAATAFLHTVKDERLLDKLGEYIAIPPEFGLKKEQYENVQTLSITAENGVIHYTTDGSEPTKASEKYAEPILIAEGNTTVRAVSINEKGIVSLETRQEYTVEFPVTHAPAVAPSTGFYSEAKQITVEVPEGYIAYYTIDGTVPTVSSARYTAPIDMPQGITLFSVVLIDSAGRTSNITQRSYDLNIVE